MLTMVIVLHKKCYLSRRRSICGLAHYGSTLAVAIDRLICFLLFGLKQTVSVPWVDIPPIRFPSRFRSRTFNAQHCCGSRSVLLDP